MKRILLVASLLILANALQLNAQIDFESLEMPSYKNGSNGAGTFTQSNLHFINHYNSDYSIWSGFAVSKAMDTETSGYINQYSAITGEGFESSDNYMVSYVSGIDDTYIKLDAAQTLGSFQITNNTYAHNSMRDGDGAAKQFGGTDGNDEDWFLLTVTGFNEGMASTETIEFYLADFRFEDNTEDYIVNTWETVELTTLGEVDSLVFSLSSTDNGEWGLNTPSYFCLDNIVTATETIDFEAYDFDYWNGENLAGQFINEEATFFNSFSPSTYGGYWSGFAYSKKTDVTTEGFTNQYSAITGSGYENSEKYAVGNSNPSLKFDASYLIQDIQITNSTYAALSMQNGDMFAKQFGGESGDDEDFLVLTIKGYDQNVYSDSVNFYLADYRFSDNLEDYIVSEWETINLTSLGLVDSIAFSLSSSDNGDWGMNTPAYFCIDNIYVTGTGIENIEPAALNVYPNPIQGNVRIQAENISEVSITDLSGKLIYKQNTNTSDLSIDLSSFNKGIYLLSVVSQSKSYTQKVIKE